jgi:hypothetical protein
VLEDFGHRQELADRGGAFDRQRGEIGAQWLRFGEQFAQRHDRALARHVEVFAGWQMLAQRIVELLGVHAEMHPAHPQPVGAHRGRERLERDGAAVGPLLPIQRLDQRSEGQQLVRIGGGEAVGGGAQRGGIGQVRGEIRGASGGIGGSRAQRVEQRVARVDGVQRSDIARQPVGLFAEPEAQRGMPADIGATVHVVTDPGSEAERHRRKAAPFFGPASLRLLAQPGNDVVARILRIGDRGHRAGMLMGERDLRLIQPRFSSPWSECLPGDCAIFAFAQQKSWMGGEDRVKRWPLPSGPKRRVIACWRWLLVGILQKPRQSVRTAVAALAVEVFNPVFELI